MRLFSHIISGMFHPLLMVTYGVVLALTFTYLAIYPPAMKLLLARRKRSLVYGGYPPEHLSL